MTGVAFGTEIRGDWADFDPAGIWRPACPSADSAEDIPLEWNSTGCPVRTKSAPTPEDLRPYHTADQTAFHNPKRQ